MCVCLIGQSVLGSPSYSGLRVESSGILVMTALSEPGSCVSLLQYGLTCDWHLVIIRVLCLSSFCRLPSSEFISSFYWNTSSWSFLERVCRGQGKTPSLPTERFTDIADKGQISSRKSIQMYLLIVLCDPEAFRMKIQKYRGHCSFYA